MAHYLFKIDGFPLENEYIDCGNNILECLDAIVTQFELNVCWKFENGENFRIYISVNNDLVSYYISDFLNLNKYQFIVNEVNNTPSFIKRSGVQLAFGENPVYKQLLNKSETFTVLNYLKEYSCELHCYLKQESCNSRSVLLFLSYENQKPNNTHSPIPITKSFSLKNLCNFTINNPSSVSINGHEPLQLFFTPPIAYNGLKNLIYGYSGNAVKPNSIADTSSVIAGKIRNNPSNRFLTLKPAAFTYMSSVWGVPGVGKTVLSLSLISQMWNKFNIPTLVIEPSKHEYRALANVLEGGVRVMKDMKKTNILIPPKGVDIYAWSEVIIMLINMACQLPDDSSLSGYYRKAYIETYQMTKGIPRPLTMVIRLEELLAKENYSGNQAQDFIKAAKSRLISFFTYFNGPTEEWAVKYDENYPLKPLDIEELLKQPTIVELADITTPKLKSAYVYLILQHIYAYIQTRESRADSLQNLLLLEEAHNILRKTSNQDVLNNVANILAEARALQLGVVISDQSPKALEPSCVSMAQNVFSFKIVDQEDREIISHSTDGDVSKLLDLGRGNCLVRTHFMRDPEYISVTVDEEFLNNIRTANENNIRYL